MAFNSKYFSHASPGQLEVIYTWLTLARQLHAAVESESALRTSCIILARAGQSGQVFSYDDNIVPGRT